jgi:LPPG:FO 2-phospho-L-lactate transferase
MLDLVGPEQLTVIANTGDDLEIYGAHVSPDPDLVAFWLADRIDQRGWGLEGDTFTVMDGLRELGEEIWFNLGDRDLAIGIQRAQALKAGVRPTDAHAALLKHLGVRAAVLPMSDRPVRTRVMAADRWWALQEYLITARGGRGPDWSWPAVQGVQFRGAEVAGTTSQVLEAIATARAIVIGPSNPVISIGPMLALPVLRAALVAARSPIVAVSPLVGGRVLKGPTADCMRWCGVPVSNVGIARLYEGLIDGLVCDEPLDSPPTLRTDLLMDGAAGRRRLAGETLAFAAGLSPGTSRRPPAPSSFLRA